VAGQGSIPSADGIIRQPSWGRLALEFIVDVIGWLVVLGILQAIGTAALHRLTGPSLFGELILVLLLFFVVTVAVRLGFIYLARRAVQ